MLDFLTHDEMDELFELQREYDKAHEELRYRHEKLRSRVKEILDLRKPKLILIQG